MKESTEAAISAIERDPFLDDSTATERSTGNDLAGGWFDRLIVPETTFRRRLLAGVAVAISVGFFYVCWCFWVPANSGVDQNGYLFGARQLAKTGTMKYAPIDPATGLFDPHQFVGNMWVGTDYNKPTERFYPKYPIGYPLLIAGCLKIAGETWGPWLAYWINPLAMTGAVLGSFFLMRTFCGSYLALLGQLIFATSPVTMLLAVDVNSHATATFCVTLGMVALIAWWRQGNPWVALLAGLLIGYATTIRYSEATLCAAIGLVVLFRLGKFWRAPWRDWLGGILATVGWCIPVGGLLLYNLYSLGSLTGYDPTNESKPGQAFTLEHFQDNWETLLRHLSTHGLFFTFPIAIVGLAWMFAWRRRIALVMAAWIVPCFACYTFYYWAPDGTNISYLRFFLTVLPGLVLCAMWAVGHLTQLIVSHTTSWTTRTAAMAVAPIIAVLATAVQVQSSSRDLETNHYTRLMLKLNCDEVMAVAPAGSVIFATDNSLFHNLQFQRDYLVFDITTYREGPNKSRKENLDKNFDMADPQGVDPGRVLALYERLKDFDQKALDEQQRETVVASLSQGRKVFVIESPAGGRRPPRVAKQQVDVVKKLLARTSVAGESIYADVVRRWRVNVQPASLTASRDDKNRRQPRLAKSTVKPITYEQPWLVYEIAQKPLPISLERQAQNELEAEAKAKADQQAADKAATEKAKQLAEQKRRDDEKAKQLADQKRRQDEQDRLNLERQKQEAALREAQARVTEAKAQLDKTVAERVTAEKQIASLKAAQLADAEAIKKSAAELVLTQKSLDGLKQEQAKLATSVEAGRKQLAELQSQIAQARSEKLRLETPVTSPTTQPDGKSD